VEIRENFHAFLHSCTFVVLDEKGIEPEICRKIKHFHEAPGWQPFLLDPMLCPAVPDASFVQGCLFAGTLRELERYHPCSTFRQAAARVTSLVVSR
jgi:hypothetical protein